MHKKRGSGKRIVMALFCPPAPGCKLCAYFLRLFAQRSKGVRMAGIYPPACVLHGLVYPRSRGFQMDVIACLERAFACMFQCAVKLLQPGWYISGVRSPPSEKSRSLGELSGILRRNSAEINFFRCTKEFC